MRQVDGFVNDSFKVFEIKLDGDIDLYSLKIFINEKPLNKRFYSYSCDTNSLFLTFYFYKTFKYIYGDKISIQYVLNTQKHSKILRKNKKFMFFF